MSMTTIRRLTSMGILLCIMTATWPSRANICFLPTGECEQGANAKKTVAKTCADYEQDGVYFAFKKENMNCTPANIPGCTLYSCVPQTCEERGFKIESANNGTSLPEGYSSSDWNCESCKQGDKNKWKCLPRPCESGYKTPRECVDTETWVAATGATHKSGADSCGLCKTVAEMSCSEGTTEVIPSGCVVCEYAYTIADGAKKCYNCHNMLGYVRESEYSSRYNNSCYETRSKQAADGSTCYKPVEVSCGLDKYKKEETINGRYTCSCANNVYEFSADETTLQYSAAGGGDVINILSRRIGQEVEEWPYEMVSSSGVCQVSEALNNVIVRCDSNPSGDTKSHTIKLEQTEEDGRKNYITINITVDADECETGSLESTCMDRGCGYEENGHKSLAGQQCYDCNECRSGVRATIGRAIVNGFNSFKSLFE